MSFARRSRPASLTVTAVAVIGVTAGPYAQIAEERLRRLAGARVLSPAP